MLPRIFYMSGIINALKNLLSERQQQVHTHHFLEASMGASALLALADGEISFAELMARDFVLDNVKELQVFTPAEAVELFRTYSEIIASSPEKGKAKVLAAVKQLAGDRELSELLIRVCIAIAKADYNFSEGEREVVSSLCDILGLEEENFLNQANFIKENY